MSEVFKYCLDLGELFNQQPNSTLLDDENIGVYVRKVIKDDFSRKIYRQTL